MGTTCGGIAVAIDTTSIDIEKIVKDLFGYDFQKRENYCATRSSDCVYIGKSKEYLVIINSQFANNFFGDQPSETVNDILTYFSSPQFIFAFEEYDSGGSYGYSLIYEGKVKRQFRSVCYESVIDFGELEDVEKEWKNAETKIEDLDEDEYELHYRSPRDNMFYSEELLPQILLHELMLKKLGFINWNMEDHLSDHSYFSKKI